MRTLPFFCSMRSYPYHACLCHPLAYMHLYMLACMFIHESCLLVCRPCFNTMKLWTFDPNLHFSLVDTTFCFLFCLFAFLLVYLISGFFACHVYHAYLICFMSPLYAFCIFSFHRLFAGFLSIAFPCTHLEQGCIELGHDLPGTREKGKGASMLFEPSDGNQ